MSSGETGGWGRAGTLSSGSERLGSSDSLLLESEELSSSLLSAESELLPDTELLVSELLSSEELSCKELSCDMSRWRGAAGLAAAGKPS